MGDATKKMLLNYANFKGRTNRRDFWFAIIEIISFYILIGIILGFLDGMGIITLTDGILRAVEIVLSLLTFLPLWTLQVRRLHDVNQSGWWLLIGFTGIGYLILLYWFCKKSVDKNNY